jgi:superfamily I DNA/RNA helicase
MIVRPFSNSVRRTVPSVSANVRQKSPMIVRRGVHHCASLHLAVTFTNKAAKEMADRIRTMLAGEAVPSWVGTFHGLGARQLRIEPEVAVLRPGFDILDADDSKRLIKRTLKAMNIEAADTGVSIGTQKGLFRPLGAVVSCTPAADR